MFKANGMEYDKGIIKNVDFWPDILIGDFQKRRTIPADITASMLSDALIGALAEINDDLSGFAARQVAKGYLTSLDVPGVSIDGENQLTVQYKKAVFARAKADLMPEYASMSRTEAHIGQDAPETKSSLLAESCFVLRNIKGLRRVGVSVI